MIKDAAPDRAVARGGAGGSWPPQWDFKTPQKVLSLGILRGKIKKISPELRRAV